MKHRLKKYYQSSMHHRASLSSESDTVENSILYEHTPMALRSLLGAPPERAGESKN